MKKFQKKYIPTPWKVIGNSKGEGGGGVLKAKILGAKYEAKLEFPGGRGCKTKNPPWGECRYFLELHIVREKQKKKGTTREYY